MASKKKQADKNPKHYDVEALSGDTEMYTPERARFAIDKTLAKEIIKLATLTRKHNLSSLRRLCYIVDWVWGEFVDESDRRIEGNFLKVTESGFQLGGWLKYSGDKIYTEDQSITDLAVYFRLPMPVHIRKIYQLMNTVYTNGYATRDSA